MGMFQTTDEQYAKEQLKEKYKLVKNKRGTYDKKDLRRAIGYMKRRIALNTRESWEDQTWLQKKILDAPPQVIARQDPNLLYKHQLRHDDAETFLRRNQLPFYEIQNMKVRRVSKRCHEAGGGKGCDCRSVYYHPKVERGMCYRCTSTRDF